MATGTAYATLRSKDRGVDRSDDETSESSAGTMNGGVGVGLTEEDLLSLAESDCFNVATTSDLYEDIEAFRCDVAHEDFNAADLRLSGILESAKEGAVLRPGSREVYFAIRSKMIF